jgi:hypothetical protein
MDNVQKTNSCTVYVCLNFPMAYESGSILKIQYGKHSNDDVTVHITNWQWRTLVPVIEYIIILLTNKNTLVLCFPIHIFWQLQTSPIWMALTTSAAVLNQDTV